MAEGLRDRAVLVVGASSGIGAAFARAAADDGAALVVAARRLDRLEALCDTAGGGTAMAVDVADPDSVAELCERAASILDGFDLVLYAAGVGALNPLSSTDPDVWRRVFDVNVMGANLLCAAALPHLRPDAVVAFLSSRVTEDASWGFTPYAASKAALDQSIRAWRVEHPDRRFTRVVMGNTFPTEFGDHLGREMLQTAMAHWERQAIPGGMMPVDDVGRVLADMLGAALDHPHVDAKDIRFDARP